MDENQVARVERLSALESKVEAAKRNLDFRFESVGDDIASLESIVNDKLKGLDERVGANARAIRKMALIGVFVVVILAILASEAGIPVWDALKAFV